MPTNEQLYAEAEKLKDAGKLDEAAAKLDELVAQDPNYALAHSALAVVCTRLRRHDDAIKTRCAPASSSPTTPSALQP